MKQKLLLVSAAMLMTSMGAFAAGWQKPAGVDPVSGKQYYIMNNEAKQYLTGTKVWFSWATTAGLADEGQVCTLTESDGVWTIARSDGKTTFCSGPTDGRGEMHVDGSGANVTKWVFSKQKNESYHISVDPNDGRGYNTAAYLAPLCWGWQGPDTEYPNAIVGNLDPTEEGNYCDWSFISLDDIAVYDAALKLDAAIKDAKEKTPGIDIKDEEAVFANENGDLTLSDINGALSSVLNKVAVMIATVDNPYDLSSRIVNGDFAKADASAFKGTAPAFGHGAAEFYNKNYDIHQDLTDVPNGVYVFSLDGFYRAGSIDADYAAWKAGNGNNAQFYVANMTATDTVYRYGNLSHLYEGAPTVQPSWVTEVHTAKENDSNKGSLRKTTQGGVDYYIPNSMYQFSLANENNLYKGTKIAMCVTEGRISVGLKKTVAVSTDWTIFDNFSLLYYGNGSSAYQFLMADYKTTAALPEGFLAAKELTSGYAKLLEETDATTYEEYLTAVKAIEDYRALVDSNAVYWNKLKTATATAEDLVNNKDYETLTGNLSDMVTDAKDALDPDDGLELTPEEILDMVNEMMEEYESVKSQTLPGTKMTSLIVNNNFAQGDKGWTLDKPKGGTLQSNAGAKCAEAYDNPDFDIYQLITGAPAGVYQMTVQGFVRPSRDKEAWSKHFDAEGNVLEHPTDTLDAFIYMNDAMNRLSSVFTYQTYAKDSIYKGTGYWADDLEYAPEGDTVVYKSTYAYPNDMASAGIAFGRGAYITSAYGLVAEGDTMRIGMKGSIAGPNWAIFTNFDLTYQGFLPEYVKPMLEDKLKELNVSMGGEEDAQALGADVYASISVAKAAGEKALTSEDGKKMYDALCEMLPVINKITSSKALFVKLVEAYGNLVAAYNDYPDARQSVREQAETLQGELENNLVVEKNINDADVPVLIEQIEGIINGLKFPAAALEATDEKPYEVSELIVNPGFESNTDKSQEPNGWTNSGKISILTQNNDAFGKGGTYYAERWHVDGTLDLNQTLVGLEVGTYKLQAKTHCSTKDGVLYAGNDSVKITNVDDPANPYVEALIFKLEEGQTSIKIGVCATLTASTWCCVDDFRLFYYGKESALPVGPVAIETVEAVAPKAVEVYSVGGVKMAGLQKGINIVRKVDAKGTVKTYKMIIK